MADLRLPDGRCPRQGCGADVDLAAADRVSAGDWLWTCANGHHGPRFFSTRLDHW